MYINFNSFKDSNYKTMKQQPGMQRLKAISYDTGDRGQGSACRSSFLILSNFFSFSMHCRMVEGRV